MELWGGGLVRLFWFAHAVRWGGWGGGGEVMTFFARAHMFDATQDCCWSTFAHIPDVTQDMGFAFLQHSFASLHL